MNIYRLIFFALLAINLVLAVLAVFSAGAHTQGTEPQRLKNQLNRDKIILPSDRKTPVAAVSSADNSDRKHIVVNPQIPSSPPVACSALVGLSPSQINVLEAQASSNGLESREVAILGPSGWWVLIPAMGSRAAAERKITELDQLGIVDRFILSEPGPRLHAISLGWFRSEEGALKHLEKLAAQGVVGAKVVPKDDPTQDVRVELRGPQLAVEQFIAQSLPQYANAQRTVCTVNNG